MVRLHKLTFSFLLCMTCVLAKLSSIAVVPHGGMTFEPEKVSAENEGYCSRAGSCGEACQETCVAAARKLNSALKQAVSMPSVDVIFLMTPHFESSDLSRFFFPGSQTIPVDPSYNAGFESIQTSSLTELIAKSLTEQGCDAVAIAAIDNDVVLMWAEIIPLNHAPRVPVVLLSPGTGTVAEMRALGICSGATLESLQEIVGIIVSADQAHYHQNKSYLPPYGFSENADSFEKHVQCWAEAVDRRELDKSGDIQKLGEPDDGGSGSCGIYGMAIVDGIMDGDRQKWHGCVLVHEVPTYFGQMVATFSLEESFAPSVACIQSCNHNVAMFEVSNKHETKLLYDDYYGEPGYHERGRWSENLLSLQSPHFSS